jgi:CDP-glucose 4,6-dehydratase
VEGVVMFGGFYSGRRALVTGHTGFKGGWLSLWLKTLGANVSGLSLPPPTNPNFHEVIKGFAFDSEVDCDVRNQEALSAAVKKADPEILFHLAAQPIVRRSYAEPIETLETNVVGTANLLEAVRRAELPCIVIVITSDKCYENRETGHAYREEDPLGGHDVYSMSKAATELVAQSWSKSFFQPNPKLGPVATARAGNVIGGGDYAADRIVPDCIRALLEKKPILVRNPTAVRPWQHVLECLSGYLLLGARLASEGKSSPLADAFNFGPEPSSQQPVRRLVEEVLKVWPGEWKDGSDPGSPHEAKLLSLSIEKAARVLDWRPVWDFTDAVRETMTWYHHRHTQHGADMLDLSREQLKAYANAAAAKNLKWCR